MVDISEAGRDCASSRVALRVCEKWPASAPDSHQPRASDHHCAFRGKSDAMGSTYVHTRRLLFLRQQQITLHNMHVKGETSHNCHDLSGELCQRALLSFLELVENERRHDLARPTSSKELNVTTPQSVKLRETHSSRLLLCLKPFV